MLGQLDRLVSLSQLPNIRLGIIAFETQYVTAPWHGFWLYDSEKVLVETMSAALATFASPQESRSPGHAFEELAAVANYGKSARAIIARVMDDLAPEVPDDAE